MKTLLESIFDDNESRPFKFGDLFKPTEVWAEDDKYKGYRSISGRNYKLPDLYNYRLISKDSKVNMDDPKETIIAGLTKLILDLPISSKMTNHQFNEELKGFYKYYKSVVNNTRRLKAASFIFATNHSVKYNGDIKAYSDALNNWNLLDVDSIHVVFCDLELAFKRS